MNPLPATRTVRRLKRQSLGRLLLCGCLTGICLIVAARVGYIAFGSNLHVVIARRIYRSAQLTPATLENVVRARGIKTIINLRGFSPPLDWYIDECKATHRMGIAQEDIGLSATRFPSITELRRLVNALDRCQYPVLLHCRQGADRTGLACALVELLKPDGTLTSARRQLSVQYGHLGLNHTNRLDQFLDLYCDWLERQHLSHTALEFRRWLNAPNCPGDCMCDFQILDGPRRLRIGEVANMRVRVTNTGVQAWNFTTENNIGHHVAYYVLDESNRSRGLGRAGLVNARIDPGDHIDLTLVISPFCATGHLRLIADVVEEQHCFFHNIGSEPLIAELDVHD